MIVDFHAYLGRWPLYPLRIRNAIELLQRMDQTGIGASFVSSIEGVLALDYTRVNRHLARWVEEHRDRLLPVGTINPSLAGWETDVEEGIRKIDLAGFRVHPSYHGYDLCTPEALALASRLADAQRPLLVAAYLDEERFHHAALRVPPVPVERMIELIRHAPRTVIVLNNLTPDEAVQLLQEPGLPLDNVFLDTAVMDKPFDGLAQVVRRCGAGHLVFGSQTPFLYPEAMLALIQGSGLNDGEVKAILEGNWLRHPVLAKLTANRLD